MLKTKKDEAEQDDLFEDTTIHCPNCEELSMTEKRTGPDKGSYVCFSCGYQEKR